MARVSGAAGVLAVAALTVACGDAAPGDRAPVAMRIYGDSIIQMQERSVAGGLPMVECAAQFRAEVDGPEGAHAILRGGRVQYWWWTTGVEAGSYRWSQEEAGRLWVDTVFPVGTPRLSHPHGFGQPAPAHPVRAEVVFEYAASNNGEVRETEPYRFYCY
jgi:hypothetical protein